MDKSSEGLTADLAASPASNGRGPTTDIEGTLAEVLAGVVCAERVSIDSHFFDDLGANSLVMAQFCARVRKREDLPSISIKEVYQHPTIRSLATALVGATPVRVEETVSTTTPASTRRYILCGTLQLLLFLGYCSLTGDFIARGYDWVVTASGWLDIYLRSILFGDILLVFLCVLPIVAKWLLIGRWKACEFPVWGLEYVRFWLVRVLVQANPMVFFVGTPLYILYLRVLGARIGNNVTILSRTIPVCSDLLTIGSGTVICRDSSLRCYRAEAGKIQLGPVSLGRDVYIGEKTVLDINTSMGDGAQLGHTSALQSGEAIPNDQRWHGSPAQRTGFDYVRVAPATCGRLRRVSYGLYSLCVVCFLYIPLALGMFYLLLTLFPTLDGLPGSGTSEITSPGFYLDALDLSLVWCLGSIIVGLIVVGTIPRLLSLAIKPDKVYPLYGFHYAIHRAIVILTNRAFFTWLFGDSSFILYYLRYLGYDLSQVEQTGANFGTALQHDSPYLSSVGRGTMVCDGLSIINADYSNTSFRVSRVSIGAHNFLGNNLAVPSGARTGDNCLLATKVMLPLEGEIRTGVGLLGSPCFEIPRSVERDSRFDHLRTGDERRRRLAAKNWYNLRTMGLFLGIWWLHIFALMLLGIVALDLYKALGEVTLAGGLALSLAFSTAYSILVERIITAFRPLQPQFCSIYAPYYWWHERLWKVPSAYLSIFNGTPFKNVVWRLLGVRVGSRVFDDGCFLTERTLTTIGNDCTLNAASKIQCHSLEDGTFKSDYTTLGAGCTLGIEAFVHYGVVMGDGALLAANSFLMKGEEIPTRAHWGGNPARELTIEQPDIVIGVRSGEAVANPTPGYRRAHLTSHHTASAQVSQESCSSSDDWQQGQQQSRAGSALHGGENS